MTNKSTIQQLLIDRLYAGRILNNSHRGDYVEMMVLEALGKEWRHVGLGWNLWDLQRGKGESRVRIQVKQCAALQIWGPTKKMSVQFSWSDRVPNYFRRDFPDEAIENEGYFCDLFVIGVHDVRDAALCDQADPAQWRFMVVPASDVEPRRNSMALEKAVARWPLIPLTEVRSEVEKILKIIGTISKCADFYEEDEWRNS